MLNSSVHAASTAASTTGRYSGRQPGHHRVDRDLLDGALDEVGRNDRDDVVGCARRAGEHARDPLGRRRDERQAVATSPRSYIASISSSLVAERDAARAEPGGAGRDLVGREDVGVVGARTAARSLRGQAGAEAGPAR